MKVRASVKKMCKDCKVIRRRGRITVICKTRNINKDKADSLRARSRAAAGRVLILRWMLIRRNAGNQYKRQTIRKQSIKINKEKKWQD